MTFLNDIHIFIKLFYLSFHMLEMFYFKKSFSNKTARCWPSHIAHFYKKWRFKNLFTYLFCVGCTPCSRYRGHRTGEVALSRSHLASPKKQRYLLELETRNHISLRNSCVLYSLRRLFPFPSACQEAQK